MQNSFQIENPKPTFLETSRRFSWWIGPFFTAIGPLVFVVYFTWAAFQNEHYQWESFLCPFFSPLLEYDWWLLSWALLILLAPARFRLTCYYYYKVYYRPLFYTVGLHGGRKTSELPWWTVIAFVPNSSPLFPLPSSCLLRYSPLRYHSLVLFWRCPRRRNWNSGLVWVVFKLFFRFQVQLFAKKKFVQRVLTICRFNLTITQFRTTLI